MTGGMKVGTSDRPRLDTSRNGSVRGTLDFGAGRGLGVQGGGPIQRPGAAMGAAMGGGTRHFQ